MKKLVLILSFVLFSNSVFAGSCPMLASKIDAKIAKAQELREAGMKAHESGKHENLLNQNKTYSDLWNVQVGI